MKRPEEVTLSREEGEALIERVERDALSAEDRRVLVKVLTFYFWVSGDFAAFFLQNKKRGKRDGHRKVAVVFIYINEGGRDASYS